MFRTKIQSTRSQAGDTIVEVIIAVAIVSSILAGAFVVTNSSSKAVRDSEEHTQALQYLQGQVELLRTDAAKSAGLPVSLSTAFCLDSSGYWPAGNAKCFVGNIPFHLTITSPTSSPLPGTTTTFNLSATWPSIAGGNAAVGLSYKVEVTP